MEDLTNTFVRLNDNILMTVSAKAGCTVIYRMIFDFLGLTEEVKQINSNRYAPDHPHIYRLVKFNKTPNYITNFSNIKETDYIVKIVRNPYHRAVSSFIHLIRLSYAPYFHGDMSFVDFINKINQMNRNVDHHAKPQISNFEKANPNRINRIIKLENLQEEIEQLNKDFNLNLSFKTESPHHIKKDVEFKEFVGRTPHHQIKNVPEYKYFYDDEIKQLVTNTFKEDIELYGYSYDLD